MTRVLLAEDDPAISEPLARALRREGYDVDVRPDGRTALEGARDNPDLVVLDLGLPYIDGLEVCRRMRAMGKTVPSRDCEFYCIRHTSNLALGSLKGLQEAGVPLLDHIQEYEGIDDPFF